MPDTGVSIGGAAAANASPHERLRQADRLRDTGQLDAAEALYREVLEHSPANRGALLGLGFCARKRGERTGALDFFRRAASLDPEDRFPRLAAADELRDLGRLDEADTQYHEIIAAEPGNRGALIGLALSARKRGDRASALAAFRRAAEGDPENTFIALAIGDELRETGDIDGAERHYRTLLDGTPQNYGASLGLGLCARRRGDRVRALEHFRDAAAADPKMAFPWLAAADELYHLWRLDEAEHQYRQALDRASGSARVLLGFGNCALRRGDPATAHRYLEDALVAAANDRAIAVAEQVLGADSRHVRAWLILGRVYRLAGDREAALRAFVSASEIEPASPPPLLEMAIEERVLGRFQTAKRLVKRAIELDRKDIAAVAAMAEFLSLERDFDGALALYQAAIAAQPAALPAYLGASTALLHTGRPADALALLDQAETRIGISPAISARRCELLRASGDWPAALEAARYSTALFPHHFWLWRARVEIERRAGDAEAVEQLLHSPPVVTVQDRSQLDFLLGQIAAENWQLHQAIAHFGDALERNPNHAGAAWNLAQLSLLTLDLPRAREYLRRYLSIEASGRIAKGLSHHESQTQIGQLLDEYELESAALAAMVAIRGRPAADRISPLRSVAARFPDYTAAAVTVLIALRQAGHLSPSPDRFTATVSSPIPPRIAQFWDSTDVPADGSALIASWQAQHPEWEHELFDNADARRFLRDHFDRPVLTAYDRARENAQKSDIFRLAYLVARGGYYVDADDRSLASITTVVPSECELAVYQEDYGTIGNDFIGAVPGHPVLKRALSDAVDAINRGDADIIWLATGPGLLTRAFVQEMLRAEKDVATAFDRVVVLDRSELYRAVAVHCSAAYKQTARHWSNTVFSRMPAKPKLAVQ
jgi:tetratricopeptide (TPR) repeat protein